MKSMTAGSIQDPELFPIFGFMNLENSEVHAGIFFFLFLGVLRYDCSGS